MKHYLIKITYDGSSFNGWQRLKNNKNTVQQTIEDILGVHISGSGRTDAGVHARCQCADFFYNDINDLDTFIKNINENLPQSIRVFSISEVPNNFHSRKSAVSKTYSYYIALDSKTDVFESKYVYNMVNAPINYNFKTNEKLINFENMNKACKYLCGTHDFSAFTSDKTPNKSYIRTIYDIDISINSVLKDNIFSYNTDKQTLKIEITGDGFLYNMVRIICGTLLYCGLSKINSDDIPNILESKVRKNAGPTLPSNALFLENVVYNNMK
jgi:tRNA pseudouridine38-40 synthase